MMPFAKIPWTVLLILSVTTSNRGVSAFSPQPGMGKRTITAGMTAGLVDTSIKPEPTLPALFPALATSLERNGFSTPTPIQSASAARALDAENLLLIAPTGSGKTLAYLLPALSKALASDGTVLVVAPTRELAAQLQRDAVSILGVEDEEAAMQACVLAVRGILPPRTLKGATVVIGTPTELLNVFTNVNGAKEFLGGDTLSAVILDEVDVLLPLAPKIFRTSLDAKGQKPRDAKKLSGADNERRRLQEEKQKLAHNRKLIAAKRSGTELTSDNKQVVVPTELLLRMIASGRSPGGSPPQVIAGSATASRRTLDRLNRAMRAASAAASSTFETIWAKDVTVCRPSTDEGAGTTTTASETDDDESESAAAVQHTIRSVTVPSQVSHRYISLTKEEALSPDVVLAAVAKATNQMKPQTALVFLCGEFAKTNVKQKVLAGPAVKGKTSEARRNSKRQIDKKRMELMAAKMAGPKQPSEDSVLSARKTCDILGKFGIEAQVSLSYFRLLRPTRTLVSNTAIK